MTRQHDTNASPPERARERGSGVAFLSPIGQINVRRGDTPRTHCRCSSGEKSNERSFPELERELVLKLSRLIRETNPKINDSSRVAAIRRTLLVQALVQTDWLNESELVSTPLKLANPVCSGVLRSTANRRTHIEAALAVELTRHSVFVRQHVGQINPDALLYRVSRRTAARTAKPL